MPELKKASGLDFNRDFFVGYSPERINPGDKTHRVTDIVKVTLARRKKPPIWSMPSTRKSSAPAPIAPARSASSRPRSSRTSSA